MAFITTNDNAELYYEELGHRGSGPTLVFIPGLTMSTYWWRKQLPELSRTFHCVAYDPRAHGASANVEHGHRMARYSQDLHELLTQLDIDDAVAIGWSYGGMTLLSYADLFACERLVAMVIVDEGPRETSGDNWDYGFGTADENAQFLAALTHNPEQAANDLIDVMFHTPVDDATRTESVTNMLRTPSVAAYGITRDGLHQDYRDVLRNIRIPVLLAPGRFGMFPIEAHEYCRDHIPDSRLVVFENSGHAPFLEEAASFNETLTEFCANLTENKEARENRTV